MTITTLYKDVDRQTFAVCGHLSKQEIATLRVEGWRFEKPNTNKNGIPVRKSMKERGKHVR